MATVLYGRDSKIQYELGRELKSGGEGIVYAITGRPDCVAKIYKQDRVADPHIREATRDKILAMLDMHFDPYFNGRVIAAWPQDALFDNAGFFLGFIMPKMENMRSLIWATRPSDRAILWPDGYRWSYSVAIAFNLALTVEHLHQADIVVGDMNTNNILIDSKGNVTLIDTDSFNITTKTGQVYKCIVGFPEVLPPELQGKDLTKPTSQFNKYTDSFSLAVHIFNLLCNNCHPFGCLNINTAHGSSSNPQIIDNIIRGYCPYVSGAKGKTVDDALDMDIFPGDIRNLFDRAFHYDSSTSVAQTTISTRPSAQEWRKALEKLYRAGMNVCSVNPLHEFPKSFHGKCPWCEIEQRKSPKPPKPKHIAIPVLHCDKDGHILRSQTITIEYGKVGTAYVENIPGYHSLNNNGQIEVTVDRTGKASKSEIRFIYEANKTPKKSRTLFITLLFLCILYCIVMCSAVRIELSNQHYEQALQYMNLIPLYKNLFPETYSIASRGILTMAPTSTPLSGIASVFSGNNSIMVSSGQTVRVKFTAPSTGTYIFKTTGSEDTYGTLYNSATSDSEIASNDDIGNGNNNFQLERSMNADTSIYIGVRYYDTSKSGTITLNITKRIETTAIPAYTPTPKPSIPTVSSGNNSVFVSAGQTVRVKFTAPSTGTYIFRTTGSEDTYGTLYNSATSDSEIASNDDIGNGNNNFQLERSMNANTSIYIGVRYYDAGKSGSITLNISKKTATSTPKKASQNTPSPQSAQPVDIGVPNLQGRSFSRIYSGPNSSYDMNIYVYWVQVQLKQLGYYHDDLTGLFDRTTSSSISSFMNSANKSYSNSINQNVIDAISDAVGARRVTVKYGGYYHAIDYLTLDSEGTGNMNIIWSNINKDKYGPNPTTPYVTGGAYWVQYCLTHLGYNPNGIDGKFGEGTDRAVRKFEYENGFKQKNNYHVFVTYGEARRMIEMCYSRGIDISNMDWGD